MSTLGTYSVFNTVLLALQGFQSPYWAPKNFFRKPLDLDVPDNEPSTLVYFWKEGPEDNPLLATYPVYNLEQTKGDRQHIILNNLDQLPSPKNVSQNVRQLIGACPEGPAIVFAKYPQAPAYDLKSDTLYLGSNGAALHTPEEDFELLQTLVASTAKRCGRRLHPPARELFVISLASAFIAKNTGFASPPLPPPGATTFVQNWTENAGIDFLQAASDAEEAINIVYGWGGRTKALYPDQMAEYELAR